MKQVLSAAAFAFAVGCFASQIWSATIYRRFVIGKGWKSGDKAASGDNGTVNDVAFIERPATAPVIIAAYYTGSSAPADERNSVLAEVGRIIARKFSAT